MGNSGFPVSRSKTKTYAGFGDLGDGIHQLAIAHHRHQVRRRGKVAIPEIVVHGLKMPHALAGCGLQREQRVGEQIVALRFAP